MLGRVGAGADARDIATKALDVFRYVHRVDHDGGVEESEEDVSTRAVFATKSIDTLENKEHLQSLYDVGFRRVSFGVQDYDPIVQLAINRVQPYGNVQQVHEIFVIQEAWLRLKDGRGQLRYEI